MSIMDGMPKSDQEMRDVMAYAVKVLDASYDPAKMNKRDRQVSEMLRKGLSLADIAGITKEERDAVLASGCRYLRLGDYDNAHEVLSGLMLLEPLDERVIYALAATFQAQGKYEVAGRLYIHFVALDATNPEGYLRLAECFLGTREFDAARGCFEAAKIQINQGFGSRDLIAYADRMIEVTEQQSAAAAA